MVFIPASTRVGGCMIGTSATFGPARHSGGVASLSLQDEHWLYAGLTRLPAFPPPHFLCELLIEAAKRRYNRAEMLDRFDRYAAIPPSVMHAAGGDRFPPRPLRSVP